MAHENKIEGIGGVGSRPSVGPSAGATGPPGAATGGAHASGIDTKDHVKLSDESQEEPGATSPASKVQPTLGVTGINHAGVISPTSGANQGYPKGIHSGGVIVSGQSPNSNFLSGTAGKLYS